MRARYICAIDPGNIQSAYCLMTPDLQPVSFMKAENEVMYEDMMSAVRCHATADTVFVIEDIVSYGMSVGREVFDTCKWIGRLQERLKDMDVSFVNRLQEKQTICHSQKANDTTIRQALIDRFAYGVPNKGKGTKKEPGWFYGFRADVWSAYAVGVTYHDLKLLKGEENVRANTRSVNRCPSIC